jgi:hypothetical protein
MTENSVPFWSWYVMEKLLKNELFQYFKMCPDIFGQFLTNLPPNVTTARSSMKHHQGTQLSVMQTFLLLVYGPFQPFE